MKKIIAIAMVVVLALTAVVGTTFAYFTDEDSDVNVMTVGNVQIEQNEQQRDENGALEEFEQNQDVKPVVGNTGAKKDLTIGDYTVKVRDDEMVKNYMDKIVTVTNTGANDAYVRTIIAFPEVDGFDTTYNAANQWLHWNGVSDTDTNPKNGWMWGRDKTEWPGNTDNWDVVENVIIDGKTYDLYVATNKNIIKPGETTAPNLLGFFLDQSVGYDDNGYYFNNDGVKTYIGDISDLNILVATQAVQAEGFADAWTALDTAFYDVSQTSHPWVEINNAFAYSDGKAYTLNDTIVVSGDATDAVTVSGDGSVVTIVGGYYDAADKDCAVWAKDSGKVIIEDGYFTCDGLGEPATSDNHQDMIYAGSNGGVIEIKGGFFEARSEGAWLLNEKDGQGEITVYGGTFVNWNPADKVSEGANTSFVAEGYMVVIEEKADGDIWYTVVAE